MPEIESSDTIDEVKGRKVSWLLIFGIVIVPFVFVWFLLRNRYSTLARALGFGWAGLVLLGFLFSPPPSDQNDVSPLADASEDIAETSIEGEVDVEDSEGLAVEAGKPRPVSLSEEKRKGLHCLSSWDGSHRGFATFVRDRLREPSSFDHVETRITPIDEDGEHRLVMTYRAKNGFGGTNVERAIGLIANEDCSIVDVQM